MEAIKQAEKEMEAGLGIPHEEVMKELQELFQR
ncbi:putative transcriptional regulator [Parabacteroides sp. PF5-6]|nr:putative transcriptional regulator [Parabacteroides sp. PF5-6]